MAKKPKPKPKPSSTFKPGPYTDPRAVRGTGNG